MTPLSKESLLGMEVDALREVKILLDVHRRVPEELRKMLFEKAKKYLPKQDIVDSKLTSSSSSPSFIRPDVSSIAAGWLLLPVKLGCLLSPQLRSYNRIVFLDADSFIKANLVAATLRQDLFGEKELNEESVNYLSSSDSRHHHHHHHHSSKHVSSQTLSKYAAAFLVPSDCNQVQEEGRKRVEYLKTIQNSNPISSGSLGPLDIHVPYVLDDSQGGGRDDSVLDGSGDDEMVDGCKLYDNVDLSDMPLLDQLALMTIFPNQSKVVYKTLFVLHVC
jgi:hypothetical protein